MSAPRLRAALAVSALALPLGGCVAAAIPLVAGGAIVTRDDTPEERSVAELATPRFEGPAAAANPPAVPEPAPAAPLTSDEAALAITPPDPALAAAPGLRGDYDAFLAHASAQAALDPVEAPRSSAILAAPGSLTPATTECAILPPAVVIDLDPKGGTLEIDALAPDPVLARGLAALRLQGVAVNWISGLSAGKAGALRARLRETGLDPEARDALLLMRRAEDRKQIRRRELSQTHCVVAIAGDERTDFDELFGYLKDPADAADLAPLVGAGWFLVSNPQDTKED